MSADELTSRFGYQPSDNVVPGYRLEKLLGLGNFGEVWRAVGPGRVKVAIKILDLSHLSGRLERRALERIRDIVHPNLVSIFGIWTISRDGGVVDDVNASSSVMSSMTETMSYDPSKIEPASRLVIAMQLGGESLYRRLQECQEQGLRGIPVDELLGYMQDAARGIDYLNEPIHDLGNGPVSIVHGDIKPQNLLLVGGGVQVCDYSLIRALEDVQKTAMGGGSCTPAYAAPELHVSKPSVTSDQYCLAMSYIELRTGNLPFPTDIKATDLFYVKYEKRLEFSGLRLSPQVLEVLKKALDPSFDKRFGSSCEMVQALRDAESLRRSHTGFRVPAPPGGWLRFSFVSLALLLVVAISACLIYAPARTAVLGYFTPKSSIHQLIERDEFHDAFERAVALRVAEMDAQNDFELVLDKWKGRVVELGANRDFSAAIRLLLNVPKSSSSNARAIQAANEIAEAQDGLFRRLTEQWDAYVDGIKDVAGLMALGDDSPRGKLKQAVALEATAADPRAKDMVRKWGDALGRAAVALFTSLANDPNRFNERHWAVLQGEKEIISADDRRRIVKRLDERISAQFEEAVDRERDFRKADQLLENVARLLKTGASAEAGLNFDPAAKRQERFRKEFQYCTQFEQFDRAREILQDPERSWPEKKQDAEKLATQWHASIQKRFADLRGHPAINDDVRQLAEVIRKHCEDFGQAFPDFDAAIDVRLTKIRMGFLLNGEFAGELQDIKAKSSGERQLLVGQLELIDRLPELESGRMAPSEAKRLLNEILQLPPGNNPQTETSLLLAWEKDSYLEAKKKITEERPRLNPIETLDGGIARAGTVDAAEKAINQADGQIEKSPNDSQYVSWKNELEKRKAILAELRLGKSREQAERLAAKLGSESAQKRWARLVAVVLPKTTVEPIQPSVTDIDAHLRDILANLRKGDAAAAAAKLAEAEDVVKKQPPQDADAVARRIEFWKNVIALAGNKRSAADAPGLLTVLGRIKPVAWNQAVIEVDGVPQAPLVCNLLKDLADVDSAALIDEALGLVDKARQGYPREQIQPCLIVLFRKRVELLVAEDFDPKGAAERFERLDRVWQWIRGGGKPEPLGDWEAWSVEYRIRQPSDDKTAYDQALAKAPWLPTKASRYVSYVRSLGVHEKYDKNPGLAWGLSSQEWDAYLGDLHRVLGEGSGETAVSPERLRNAKGWASAAIAAYFEKEVLARSDIEFPLSAAMAETVCGIARRIEPDVSALPAELKVPYAVAATCLASPDVKPAEEVLRGLDTEGERPVYRGKVKKAAPLLYVYLRQLLKGNPADLSTEQADAAFVYAKWLLDAYVQTREEQLAEPGGARLSGPEAAVLAKAVLDPGLGLADASAAKGAAAGMKARLAAFYEAAFDFSQRYPDIQLPEYAKGHSPWRIAILDAAISLAEQLEKQSP